MCHKPKPNIGKVPFFGVFGITRLGIESPSPEQLANSLSTRPFNLRLSVPKGYSILTKDPELEPHFFMQLLHPGHTNFFCIYIYIYIYILSLYFIRFFYFMFDYFYYILIIIINVIMEFLFYILSVIFIIFICIIIIRRRIC